MRQSACCVLILFIIFHKVAGQSVTPSMTITASTVVEGSTTPSMTFNITSASPQRNSSASPMFTGQPSSTFVFLSSSGVSSFSTQIYNSNESTTEPPTTANTTEPSTTSNKTGANTTEPPITSNNTGANTTEPASTSTKTGGTEEPDAKPWKWIAIGASVGGVVVFVIVVIIVCRCLKRKRKNRNVVLPNDADADDKPGGNVAMESYNQSEERLKLAPSQ